MFWSMPVLCCDGTHANKFGGGLPVCSHGSPGFWSMPVLCCGGTHANKFGGGLLVCSHGSPMFWSMPVLCCGGTHTNKFGGGLPVCSHSSPFSDLLLPLLSSCLRPRHGLPSSSRCHSSVCASAVSPVVPDMSLQPLIPCRRSLLEDVGQSTWRWNWRLSHNGIRSSNSEQNFEVRQ
jgi:hypothetical protein